MKLLVLKTFMLSCLISGSMFAQDFSGRATYKTHRKSSFKLDSTTIAANPGIQEQMEAQMRKMFQKTFTLDFTKSESMYKEEQELDAPKGPSANGGVMVMMMDGNGSSDILYKNISENRMANKTELMGKVFLIKDNLEAYDWKLTGEAKNIGNYTCYKAAYEKEEEDIQIDMIDGEVKEEKVTKKRTLVAWYTPDVPVSNGPNNYGGLPGLILEVNDGDLTIVCSELVLNPKEAKEIKEPVKGKIVTRKKFAEISLEKTKEMMNRYRSRDGKGMEIKIGG
ncbi:GLPGLI family protein [Flavobacteriaceae bacterium]|nr:GLPGLI family protein [Flavobacteriaceae bacterium]MDB9780973.1 GLPGLI family protein [Flavobacteriaceae bacterium]